MFSECEFPRPEGRFSAWEKRLPCALILSTPFLGRCCSRIAVPNGRTPDQLHAKTGSVTRCATRVPSSWTLHLGFCYCSSYTPLSCLTKIYPEMTIFRLARIRVFCTSPNPGDTSRVESRFVNTCLKMLSAHLSAHLTSLSCLCLLLHSLFTRGTDSSPRLEGLLNSWFTCG